jgi:uncharacterized RDD family membrane protein YckC
LTNKYNTFWKRFFAGIIDGLVFFPFIIVEIIFPGINNTWSYNLLYLVCWTLYLVIGHGKYGQTVGKRIMKIKVFDLDEKNIIGYKRAFFRESVWFFVSIAGIIWMYSKTGDMNPATGEIIVDYYDISMIVSIAWLIVELITMLSNSKRRAVHDFIAGSVVIDLNVGTKIIN